MYDAYEYDLPKRRTQPANNDVASSSFSSLPDDLAENCLARISRSYYPSLSLVSKSFRSLIASQRLRGMRNWLGTKEEYVCVCLKLPDLPLVSWYSLWIKKTQQTLTMDKQKSTGNWLVPIPSPSYIPCIPILWFRFGSRIYTLGENDTPSTDLSVFHNGTWLKSPSMSVPRARAMNVHAVILNEKIYVMGGCEKDESTKWAEVFDTKTQTWETLQDPGAELRNSLIKRLWVCQGKIYVKIVSKKEEAKKHYVYDPKEGKWDKIEDTSLMENICRIKNMMYTCHENDCYWCDSNSEYGEWEKVKGLDLLEGEYNKVEITKHGDKLLLFFEESLRNSDPNKKIWCAVVALERRYNQVLYEDEVWGKIEWTDIVLEVPQSSTILGCENAWF